MLAFPLAGAVLIALTSKLGLGRVYGVIGTLAIFLSFLAAVGAYSELQSLGEEERQVVAVGWDYAVTSGVDARVSILLDPLSVLMMLIVSGVSALIHLYSVAYMGGDRGYARFFAFLNFFVFSMLLLVAAANFLLLIIGWAFVGAASYFLISFWYRRKTATDAGIKAFVINVLGDVGLVLGTYFIFTGTGTLDFLQTFEALPEAFAENDADLVAGCLLLLVGAFAKSAQVPLHTWLPDAMEGPTPVSALIHAATMVTAGVYLIARMHPLFELAPIAADVGAVIGCLDAADRRHDRPRRDRPQARHRVLDDVADRLHGHGRELGRLRRRHVPPDDARLLQGAALHGRRLGDRGDGRRPEPRPHVGLQARDAVHLRLHDRRRPGALRHPAVLGLLLQGRDHLAAVRARRLPRRARRARLPRRVPDGDLHVPDDLPRLPRRPVRGGQGARARAPVPRRAPDQPDDR